MPAKPNCTPRRRSAPRDASHWTCPGAIVSRWFLLFGSSATVADTADSYLDATSRRPAAYGAGGRS